MEAIHRENNNIESVLKRWYQTIPKYSKAAFLSTFLVGLLVHLYMFTNKLPNHDDIAGMFTNIDFVSYGRWLSRFFTQINTTLSMPWVNGIVALIFAALSAVLVVQVLKIHKVLYAALTGAIMACTPFMANTFTYMSGADMFLIAVFIGILGAYVSDRYSFGFLIGAVMFTIVLAIYQTMVLLAITLMVIKLLLDVLDPGCSHKVVIRTTLRYILTVVIAAVLYVCLTKLVLYAHSASLSYSNTAEILSPNLAALPQRFLQCYSQFVGLALGRSPYFNTHWMLGLYILTVFSFCLLIGLLLLRNKGLGIWRVIVTVLIVLILPVVFFSGHLAAGYTHILMQLPLTMLFIGLIALFCRYDAVVDSSSPKPYRFFRTLGSWFVALAMIACCYSWALYSNQVYFTLQRKFDACYSLSTRMVDRVEQLPEYTIDTPVLVVGDFSKGNYPVAVPEALDGLPYSVGIGEPSEFYYMKGYWGTVHNFIAAYLGVRWQVPDAETVAELVEKTNDFADMPIFPSAGSVFYIDGVIVVMGSAS